jgi:hypothetical protein
MSLFRDRYPRPAPEVGRGWGWAPYRSGAAVRGTALGPGSMLPGPGWEAGAGQMRRIAPPPARRPKGARRDQQESRLL